jgi:hypothetical protein
VCLGSIVLKNIGSTDARINALIVCMEVVKDVNIASSRFHAAWATAVFGNAPTGRRGGTKE